MNIYHRNLDIPIKFIPYPIAVTDEILRFKNNNITRKMINIEFHEWLASVGLYCDPGLSRYFQSHPYQRYSIHADSPNENTERTKINLIFDSVGTEMIWYELQPKIQIREDANNSIFFTGVIRNYNETYCREVLRLPVNGHCLIDGAKIHTLINSSNDGKPRKCYSITLARLEDKKLISFAEAVERLSAYIK